MTLFHAIKNLILGNRLARIHSMYQSGFFLMVSQTLLSYIFSSYLAQYVGKENVGFVFAISCAAMLIINNTLPNFLAKNGVLITTLALITISAAGLSVMWFATSAWPVAIGFIFYNIAGTIVWTTFDILLKRNTIRGFTGRIRGMYATINSIGLIATPLISGILFDRFGMRALFLSSIILLLPVVIGLIVHFKIHEPKLLPQRFNFISMARQTWLIRPIRNIFIVSILLSIFYSTMVIYTPIYLHQYIGLSWPSIGIIFTVMLLPFALLEYPVGLITDKKHNYSLILSFGLMITAVSTLLIPAINTPNMFIWMAVLFLTRTGASLSDTIIESYFFENVQAKDIDLIIFFRNSPTIAYLIGPSIFSVIMHYSNIYYVFIATSMLVALGIFFSLRLKKVK